VNVNTDKTPAPRGIFREGGIAGFDFNDKRVAMPSFAPGDSIEYDVETVVHTPLTPGQFSEVYSFTPCGIVDEQLEINIPADREVKLKTKPGIGMSIANENGRRIYRWTATHEGSKFDGVRNKSMVQDLLEETPDVQISTFTSWEDVGRWYAEMERGRRVPSPAVRSKAEELTKGMKTDLEKVAALYDFTARIKYFSIAAFGLGGYEPHTADEVLHIGYGDCKDKDTLLSALLEAEGFHSSSVLINPIRKLDADVPSLWPFTHVITMLPLGKDEIWMDSSVGVLPFRMLSYDLRNKPSLVIPFDGSPRFEDTPSEAPMTSSLLEDIDGKVDTSGIFEATVSITARGDAGVPLREAFLSAVESARPLIIQGLIRGVTGNISGVKVSDPTATRDPFTFSFQVNNLEFLLRVAKTYELTLPMSDFNLAAADSIDESRRMASKSVRVGVPGDYTYRIRLQLAPRFALQVPPDARFEREYAIYTAKYELERNSLAAERKLILHKNELSLALAEDYIAFRKKVLTEAAQRVVVTVR
jgi:hypothetical protein